MKLPALKTIVLVLSAVFWMAAEPAAAQPRPAGDGQQSAALRVGDPAPNFKLKTMDGQKEVELSSFKGHKPVVLVFGSFT